MPKHMLQRKLFPQFLQLTTGWLVEHLQSFLWQLVIRRTLNVKLFTNCLIPLVQLLEELGIASAFFSSLELLLAYTDVLGELL